MANPTTLHPSVLNSLKPFVPPSSGSDSDAHWRFHSYVESNENKFWGPTLALSEQVKFLLSLVPKSLYQSARSALERMETAHLAAAGYQPAVDGPFYAPMSKSN